MSQDGDGLQADAIDRPGPPPELRDPPRRSQALGAFLATFALAAFAGVIWYAYDQGLQAGSEATAPLIQADPSPVKVRPEQPGGLDVPNQDKLVYGALRPGQGSSDTVERLLPPPETPAEPPRPEPSTDAAVDSGSENASGDGAPTAVDRGAPGEESAATADGGSAVSATVPIPARAPQPVPSPAKADAAPAQAAAPQPTPQPTPQSTSQQTVEPDGSDVPPARVPQAPDTPARDTGGADSGNLVASAPPPPPPPAPEPKAVPAPAPVPAPQPTVAAPPAPGGTFRVQLGAFRDEAAARREWDRLSRRYPDVLSGLTLRVQQVDLGAGKGVFHRIQGGMLTEAAADRVCASLKSRNQACLLVRP
ncbi:MAG: SPOR domain-containing protein [Alphaproteobacteria bacterium]|nr:SPOR domain-containing protein [Alphaproteobacteria bacterium]